MLCKLNQFSKQIKSLFIKLLNKVQYFLMQAFWEYTNKHQYTYLVGLYHGDKSNHVIIYCDNSIIKIDFNIVHTISYNFMLDDELFSLKIDIQNEIPNYILTITDHNKIIPQISQKTKKLNRKHLILITLIVTFALLFFLSMTLILK